MAFTTFFDGYLMPNSVKEVNLDNGSKGYNFSIKSYKNVKNKDGKFLFIVIPCSVFGIAKDFFETGRECLVGKKVCGYGYLNSLFNGEKYDITLTIQMIQPAINNYDKSAKQASKLGVSNATQSQLDDSTPIQNEDDLPF